MQGRMHHLLGILAITAMAPWSFGCSSNSSGGGGSTGDASGDTGGGEDSRENDTGAADSGVHEFGGGGAVHDFMEMCSVLRTPGRRQPGLQSFHLSARGLYCTHSFQG